MKTQILSIPIIMLFGSLSVQAVPPIKPTYNHWEIKPVQNIVDPTKDSSKQAFENSLASGNHNGKPNDNSAIASTFNSLKEKKLIPNTGLNHEILLELNKLEQLANQNIQITRGPNRTGVKSDGTVWEIPNSGTELSRKRGLVATDLTHLNELLKSIPSEKIAKDPNLKSFVVAVKELQKMAPIASDNHFYSIHTSNLTPKFLQELKSKAKEVNFMTGAAEIKVGVAELTTATTNILQHLQKSSRNITTVIVGAAVTVVASQSMVGEANAAKVPDMSTAKISTVGLQQPTFGNKSLVPTPAPAPLSAPAFAHQKMGSAD